VAIGDNAGCNFTVGTIAGVWSTDKLVGVKSRDLKAAVVALYGPRTTVSLALDGLEYGHELTLVPANFGLRWEHSRVFKNIEEGSIFAPGNMPSICILYI
jgi:sedoheptulose-bisphosphatase